MKAVLLLLLTLIPSCLCMFEDEIGLADWYQPHIGKIHTAVFVPPRQIVVATESNVLAALNVKTGDLMWRQVLPKGTTIDKIHYFDQNILLVSGRRVSVWSTAEEGSLRWEEEEESDIIEAKINEGVVSVATASGIILRSAATGASVHASPVKTIASQSTIHYLGNMLYAIYAQDDSFQISSVALQAPYAHVSKAITLSSAVAKGEQAIVTADGYVAVLSGTPGNFKVNVHQLQATSKVALSFALDSDISEAKLLALGNDSFVVRTATEQLVFRHKSDTKFPFIIAVKLPLETKASASGSQFVYCTTTSLHYTNRTGKYHRGISASPSAIFLLPPSSYLLVVEDDWSARVYALNTLLPSAASISSSGALAALWEREEALAAVVRSEIVDLPPDVTELIDLVHEFEDQSKWFVARIMAQIDQIKHAVMNAGATITSLIDSITNAPAGRKFLSEKELVTKDKFGFRKLIVAVTASGKVFGVSTDHGQIAWGKHVRTTGFSKNAFIYVTRSSAAYPPEIIVGDANLLHKMNPLTGEVISSTPTSSLAQVLRLPLLYTHIQQGATASHSPNTHVLLLVHSPASPSHTSLSVSLFPETAQTKEIFQNSKEKIHFFLVDKATSTVSGYAFTEKKNSEAQVAWNVTFGQEVISGLASFHPHDKVYHPAAVLGDRNIMPKYINKNLVGVATVSGGSGASVLHIYLLDTVTGAIVFHTQHADCGGINDQVALVLMENSLVYTYWNTKTYKHQMSVVDLYTKTVDWKSTTFSSYTAPLPISLQQSYVLSTPVTLITHTSSTRGITAKHLLLGLASDAVVSLDKRWADARRPLPQQVTAADREENLIPYHPRLHFPSTSYLTYNRTVSRLNAIVTTGSSLESTTLVVAVGLDMFFTRVYPAEAYDILTSDFNYIALILTITLLCIATLVTTNLSRRKDILRTWK